MSQKVPTKDALHRRRVITISYLLVKAENEDWHGVADAAMDLREIDAKLEALNAQADAAGSDYPRHKDVTYPLSSPPSDTYNRRLG
jgi:hypothetical protein